jgi:hypothetical protein
MRALVLAVTGVLVTPIDNGAVLRLAVDGARCVAAEPV